MNRVRVVDTDEEVWQNPTYPVGILPSRRLMKLTTRVRYGTRALADLAAAYPDGTLSVKEMARREAVSAKYLEHIVNALKASGLIQAIRGMHGGYVLSRAPERISLNEVFRVLEGSPAPVDCVENPESCPMRKLCPTRDMWVEIGEAIEGILESTTLRDLAERKRSKANSAATYQI